MKRVISFAMTVVLALGLVPAPAFAVGGLQAQALFAADASGAETVELVSSGNEELFVAGGLHDG